MGVAKGTPSRLRPRRATTDQRLARPAPVGPCRLRICWPTPHATAPTWTLRTALRTRVERLEAEAEQAGGLSDEDRAHILAWQARMAERWHAGLPPTEEQLTLLARPGFWSRLQRAWARPAFARMCLEAIERRQTPAQTAIDR